MIKVYKDPYARHTYDDGRPCLFTLVRWMNPPYVLVHPDRWDAFVMAINQPDIFRHPEVQELLGLTNGRQAGDEPESDAEKRNPQEGNS